jgi:branched-chain amino acid transport system substrate-binding protein
MKGDKPEKFVAELQPLLRKTTGLPPEIEHSMYDANIYEIASIYVAAIKASGVTGKPDDLDADRTKIRDYMAKLEGFPGLGGPIGFNDDGDAIKAFYVLQGQNGAWDSKVRGCSAAPGHPGC